MNHRIKSPLGSWGGYIVVLSVLLFAISTAISWSYYGDRCANYLFGPKAILPYKVVFVIMHFVGAIFALSIFLFTAGLQFILFGLVAELIVRTYHESQDKPTYLLRSNPEERK